MEKTPTGFSENLKRLMLQYNCKNIDLAKRLHVSKSTISNYLSGTSTPNVEMLEKISYHFCYPMNLLLEGRTSGFRESTESPFQNIIAMIPYFHMCLAEQYGDIYINDNFQSCFYFPMNIREKSRCYAVKMYTPDSIVSEGFHTGSIAIFSRDEDFSFTENEIVAVHLKEKGRIVIRKIHIVDKHTAHLVSDNDTIPFTLTEENKNIEILGKVVYKLSHL